MGWCLKWAVGSREGRGFYEVMKRATYFYADGSDLLGEKLMLEQSPSARERKCDLLSSGGKQGQASGHTENREGDTGRLAV